MKIRFSHVLALALTAGVAVWMGTGSYIEGGHAGSPEATPPPAARQTEADETPFRVSVREIAAEPRTSTLVIRGRTEAEATVEVRAETTGRVTERPVSEGQSVTRGDTLCVLDAGARKAGVAEAEAVLAQAELDHSAAIQLKDKGFTAQTRVAALKAQMDAAQARLEEARLELSRIDIKAPIAGVVVTPLAEVGTMLSAGQACAKLIDNNPMLMIGQVSEREVGALNRGDKASIMLVSGEAVDGAIRYISPTADAATRTFRIEIEMNNDDGMIRDGLTADARIPLTSRPAHHLSSGILTLDDDGTIGVRAVGEDNRVTFLPVTLLGGDDDGVWVSGLPETVRVIVTGQDYVVEGQTVDPVLEAEEARG
ncbi:efflux RND transporter periplasmic adaptor subunit [Stappia sp. ICDLI1TA098]|jgi:multidrug efflux system membrane fusion protein